MEEIVINGVSLTKLKAKQEAFNKEVAAVRSSIQQGAAAFMAEKIAEAQRLVSEIVDYDEEGAAEHEEQIITHAKAATSYLEQVVFVSEVSGVAFSLPYSEGGYSYCDMTGKPITYLLYSTEFNNTRIDSALHALYSVAEDAEGSVRDWQSSYC